METTPYEYGALKQKVNDHDNALTELRTEMRSGFSALTVKLDERANRDRPQVTTMTAVVGTGVLLVSSLGWLALEPLKNRLFSVESVVQNHLVARSEHVERWRSNEKDLDHLSARIDELRKDYNSVWGQRDLLQDLRDRLNRLEINGGWKPTTEKAYR